MTLEKRRVQVGISPSEMPSREEDTVREPAEVEEGELAEALERASAECSPLLPRLTAAGANLLSRVALRHLEEVRREFAAQEIAALAGSRTASQAHGKERLRSDLNPNLTNQPEGKVKAHDWADREEQGAGGAREMSDNKIIFGPGRRQLLEQQRQYAKDEELRSAFQQGFGAGVKSAQLAARTEGASARAVEGEQLAWLIEWPADDNLPTRYWNPDTGWMLDPHKACWFVRKQDAEAYRKQSLLSYSRIVEHKFGLSLPHPEEAPEGWVLVPREPTEAMLVSGRIAASTDDAQPITGEIKAAWHAMLSAAPTVGGRG